MKETNMKHPIATIQLASGESIKIEIYPETAPNTATSFIWLAQQGAFNNRAIKRIVPGFVIQPSYTSFDEDPVCDFIIKGEFRANGFDNPLTISKYTVAMGGDGETLASGSCFFIAVGDCEERLDGKYAGFGRVVEGFEVIDRLLQVETVEVAADLPGVVVNEPKIPEIMTQVTVETYGASFGEPVKTTGVWAYEKKQIQIGGTYKHYKGNFYKVISLAKHSETLEDMIVYQTLYGEQMTWVRPLKMFMENVNVDGKKVKRFELADQNIKQSNQNAAMYAVGKSKVTFEAEDGVQVTADLYLTSEEQAPFIILFHQARYSRGEYGEIAPKLNALGFNCMATDQRSGDSFRGVLNETHCVAVEKELPVGYPDAYPDLLAALNYVNANYKPEKLIIWGSSYSSSLALIMAAQHKERVDAVLAFSPGEYFKFEDKLVADFAAEIEQPVFITSAEPEAVNWRDMAKQIPSSQAAFFIPKDRGVHGSSALLEETVNHQEYWDAVTAFLKSIQ